jgi:hypothetical protein
MTVQAVLTEYYFHEDRKPDVIKYLQKLPIPYDRKRDILIEWAHAVDTTLTREDFDAIGAVNAALQP